MAVSKNDMKYLKIENNKGYYWNGGEYQEIDKIDKDGLLVLLNAAETDEFELDTYNEGLLANKAHQVIYENVHSKFEQFLGEKSQFKTEVNDLYSEAIGKYSADIQNENLGDTDAVKSESDEEEVNAEDIPF